MTAKHRPRPPWRIFLSCLLLAATDAQAQAGAGERLEVDDPYVEVRTGPGDTYPVTQVAVRHESIWVEFQRADWYKVHTQNGSTGWVDRRQLEHTLTESGRRKSFRDVLIDDYLARRLELGAGWGHTQSAPFVRLSATYYLRPTFAVEARYEQIQGLYSGTSAWNLGIETMPWNFGRWQPYAGLGLGRSNFQPSVSLISAHSANSNTAEAELGVRAHVTDRLMVRLDWQQSVVLFSAGQTDQFHMLSAGVSFFF